MSAAIDARNTRAEDIRFPLRSAPALLDLRLRPCRLRRLVQPCELSYWERYQGSNDKLPGRHTGFDMDPRMRRVGARSRWRCSRSITISSRAITSFVFLCEDSLVHRSPMCETHVQR